MHHLRIDSQHQCAGGENKFLKMLHVLNAEIEKVYPMA